MGINYTDLENAYQSTVNKLMVQLDSCEDIDILERTLSFDGVPTEFWKYLIEIALNNLYY